MWGVICCSTVICCAIAPSRVSAQQPTLEAKSATSLNAAQNAAPVLPDSPGAIVSRTQSAVLATDSSGRSSKESTQIAEVQTETNQDQEQGTQPSQTPSQDQQSQGSQQQQPPHKPVGTAAAGTLPATGIAASQPAGVAIAPAKQRRVRTILIRTGAILGAGVAVGSVVALTKATPSKPPGAR